MDHIVERNGDDTEKCSLTCIHDDIKNIPSACDQSKQDSHKRADRNLDKRNQLVREGCAMLDCISEKYKSRDPVQQGLVDEKDER